MTLTVHAGIFREPVRRQLAQLVPPEVWSMDAFGFIDMRSPPPEGIASPATQLMWRLVSAPGLIEIAGTEGASGATLNGSHVQLREIGGAAFFDPLNQGPEARVTLFYDTTNNYALGYWTEGDDGKHIAMPPHILLAHEMAHAAQVLEGTWVDHASGEVYAIAVENAVREASQPALPQRRSHNGGPNLPPKKPAPAPTKSGCFVATAAYGSSLDPAVEELRDFRENVLLKTRHGTRLHDRLLPFYRRASQPIIAAMAASPDVHEVVRDWVVRPVVQYLRLARDFPDLPTDAAGPWAPFVSAMRDGLAEFAKALPLPSHLRDIEPEQAVEELIVALCFQLRTSESRMAWLSSMRQRGELPLQVPAEQRAGLALRLVGKGRTPGEVDAILGPPDGHRGTGLIERRHAVSTGFGHDVGTQVDAVSWRYTVTLRNNMPGTTLYGLRVYYLAQPGQPDNMGVVTLPDLLYSEVGVFPLCECTRLVSWYLEADFTDAQGSGTIVWPDQGSVTPASAGDPHPCEDSFVLEE